MVGEKLKRRRLELGLTLEEVGNKVGVGKSTVRKWEQGMIENMGRDKIVALSKALEMSPIEILDIDFDESYSRGNLPDQYLNEAETPYEVMVKAMTVSNESADQFENMYGLTHKKVYDVPKKASKYIVIDNDSMSPDFKKYSLVFFNPDLEVNDGDLAIIKVKDKDITFKQVSFSGDSIKLIPLNKEYNTISLKKDDFEILGKVII